jgi:outer membrane receptor protein involved in Fe transport
VGVNAYGRFDLHAENRIVPYDAAGRPQEEIHDVAIESARKDDLGVFASVDGRAGRFTWGGGLRVDRVATSNDGGYFGDVSTSETALSGFVSAGMEVAEGVELTGQVARGFRDPLLSDRYYRGFTGRGFITGNPELEPETSLQYDLALRLGRGSNQLSVFGYFYSIQDLIERYREGGDFFFRNRGEAEILGLEVEATVALSASMTLALGAQALRGEVADDGSPMDNIPALGGFVVLRGEPTPRWWWTFRGSAYARDDRPGPTEQVTPGYATVNVGAGYRLSEALEIQVLGRNLLDKAYLASADEEAVLAPGRTLVLTLRGKV